MLYLQYIGGVSLYQAVMSEATLVQSVPLIKTFTNLTSLDLSLNSIDVTCPESAESLVEILSSLPKLERLDLSYLNFNGMLSRFLSRVPLPLVSLRLRSCLLQSDDLKYLEKSHHITGLKDLDLSLNDLSTVCPDVFSLLRSSSLTCLRMESVNLDPSAFIELFVICSELENLQLLFLNHNRTCLNYETLLVAVPHLTKSPKLYAVILSYPSANVLTDFQAFLEYRTFAKLLREQQVSVHLNQIKEKVTSLGPKSQEQKLIFLFTLNTRWN